MPDDLTGGEEKEGEAPEKGQAETSPESPGTDFDAGLEEAKEAALEPGEGEEHETVEKDADETTVSDPILMELEAAGVEHTFKNGADFIQSHVELRKQQSGVDQERTVGRELMPHLADIREYLAGKQKQEVDSAQKEVWDVPPMPVNHEGQMDLPAEQRDPAFVDAMNKRTAYVDGKWQGYTHDPSTLFDDHFRGSVQAMITQETARVTREGVLHDALDPQKEFINEHYDEVRELAAQMPLEYAVELVKGRHGGSPADKRNRSAAAKQSDAAKLGKRRSGPVGVAPVSEETSEEEDMDDQAIARRGLETARLDGPLTEM